LSWQGYYQLSAYALPFQNGGNDLDRHHFKLGTTFEQVVDLCIFDRKLRLLVMDAIERIEVAIRAAISNVASIKHSPHWFLTKISQDNDWEDRLEALFQEYPGVDPIVMDFPPNWRSLPIWG
jgi:abortive infection bacteriophage resistance protein